METSLLDQALKLAQSTKMPVAEICREIGVTTRWYYMLLNDEIKDPSVNKIQRLHDFLAEKNAA